MLNCTLNHVMTIKLGLEYAQLHAQSCYVNNS